MREADRGVSPGRLAWRRLRRSRAAMISLAIVVIVAVACSVARLAGDPLLSHAWLGARAPGFAHPDCLTENVFAVGKPAETSAGARACRELEILVDQPVASDDYRIALRRKVVRSITRLRGAEALDALDLGPVPGREILDASTLGSERGGAVLRVGEEPPRGWCSEGGVLMLRVARPSRHLYYDVAIDAGTVRAVSCDGVAIQRAVIDGATVTAMTGDGRPVILRHALGTDSAGRDVLARALYGGRVSLAVGAVATAISLLIGVLYGAIAGYCGALSPRGGRIDQGMMAVVDILYGVPFMFLVIVLLVNFGRNVSTLFIALGVVQWLTMARIVRGQVLSLASREFVAAARVCGSSHAAIVLRHLVPNTLGIVVIYATLTVPAVIVQEGFLAYIGLTVQWHGEALESWGALVKNGVDALGPGGERSWLLLVPALAMATTLVALNVLGDGMRDALDPHLKGRE